MATLASKYQIPVHSHDLTNILSLSQSQTLSKSKNGIINFNESSFYNRFKYNYVIKVGGVNVEKTLSFNTSDNLFDDLCILEKQILDEIYTRQQENILMKNNHATMDEYGNIKIGRDSGLSIDDDGVLSADFTSLQPKLISGENIKKLRVGNTEEEIDLLIGSDSDDKFISIITPSYLESKISDLNSKCDSISTMSESEFLQIQSQFKQYSASLANMQGQIIDLLGDLSSFQQGDSSSSSSGKVGIFVCNGTTIPSNTCDNVVLNTSKSYYRKIISESLDSCVSPEYSGPWFQFDTHDLMTVGKDYMVVKFDLDIQVEDSWLVPDVNRFPWVWIGEAPDMSNWGNTIVEIRGYWKCDIWNWFGKVVHQYQIQCNDEPINGGGGQVSDDDSDDSDDYGDDGGDDDYNDNGDNDSSEDDE